MIRPKPSAARPADKAVHTVRQELKRELRRAISQARLTKSALARRMRTSRSSIDRLLDHGVGRARRDAGAAAFEGEGHVLGFVEVEQVHFAAPGAEQVG